MKPAAVTTPSEVEYPESDGKPMGETDVHRNWIIRLIDMLMHRYRDGRVYVSGDLLVYYEQGNPRRFVVPDVFVVHDCDPGPRRVFKTWEEGTSPNVVIEVTSRSTKREDEVYKPNIYEQLGVREYFLYDPEGEYLTPPLQGYRLQADGFRRIEPDTKGTLASEELGLRLHTQAGGLVLTDDATGDKVLTSAEAANQEVERLRQLLDQRSQGA